MIRKIAIIIVAVTCVGSSVNGAHAGTRELLLSAAVPGLGQLYSGQKLKGLAFMGAGVLSLHAYINQLSIYNSNSFNTSELEKDFAIMGGTDYDQRLLLLGEWRESYDNAQTAEKLLVTFLSVYGAVWAASLADLIIFPSGGDGAEAGVDSWKPVHVRVASHGTVPQLCLDMAF